MDIPTGVERQVRRGRFTVQATVSSDYVDESCALCTEKFSDTPEWPIRRTPCNHAFHWTCLQHLLRNRAGQPKCPMCRSVLTGMSATNHTGRTDGIGQVEQIGSPYHQAEAAAFNQQNNTRNSRHDGRNMSGGVGSAGGPTRGDIDAWQANVDMRRMRDEMWANPSQRDALEVCV